MSGRCAVTAASTAGSTKAQSGAPGERTCSDFQLPGFAGSSQKFTFGGPWWSARACCQPCPDLRSLNKRTGGEATRALRERAGRTRRQTLHKLRAAKNACHSESQGGSVRCPSRTGRYEAARAEGRRTAVQDPADATRRWPLLVLTYVMTCHSSRLARSWWRSARTPCVAGVLPRAAAMLC